MERLRHDLVYALRGLARSPGLTATIILTLGLGVGANAAVFTAIDRVFLQPPPGVTDPGGVRRLYAHIYSEQNPQYGPAGKVTPFLATRDLLDLSAALRGVARISGDYLERRARLTPANEPVSMTFVAPGYFELLGVRPARGRLFAPEEGAVPGAAVPVAVISHAFWRRHFAADPAVVGKTLGIDETTTYTVVGVAAPDFEGLELEVTDFWVPLSNLANGDVTFLRLIARIDRALDPRIVDAALTAQFHRTHRDDPSVDDESKIVSASILAARGPALRGVSVLRIPGMSDRSLAVLPRLAGVGLIVLVIAVANVASLLLMRAMRRRREIAIRLALGITRPRLVMQLVAESTLLALIAGGAALLVAWWTGGALRGQLSSFRWTTTIVDERVMLFAVLMAVVTGVAAGLAPAAFAFRSDISASLHSGGSPSTSTLRTSLLVTQAALCTVLLACGGAFLQSARRAGEFDRGFDVERTIQVSIPAYDTDAEQRLARITERIREVPFVEAVGRTFIALDQLGLLTKVGPTYRDTIGVGPRGPSLEFVGADFMRAAGFRVLAGRPLDESDAFARVAVLNESLARALFPRGGAVGECVHVREPDSPCREVVGVVHDVRWDAAEQPRYRVYVPVAQAWTAPPRALVPNYLYVRMRTASTAEDLTRLRALIGPMMTHPAELSITRIADRLRPQLRPWRLAATLFLILGALGLLAAAAGIYGLVAYDVTERTRELGVRLAIGASSSTILRLVLGSGVRVVLIGVASGAAATLSVGPLVASVLFATSLYDPLILGATGLTLVCAAGVASLVPALRATRINPAIALSSD